MAKATTETGEVRAKLFRNGRSQAVRLPKEFRFEGSEVRIRHAMGGVLLEPVKTESRRPQSAAEWFADLASYGGDPIFPEGREQPEMQERDWSAYDRAE